MNSGFKRVLKCLLGRVTSDYRINWIYATDTLPVSDDEAFSIEPETAAHRAALRASSTGKMRNSQNYADAGLIGLVLTETGQPLAVAHFAEVNQYGRFSTWPLKNGEVALMDIATEESERGRGLAPRLIRAATRHYMTQGRKRLIAFVWWSNNPSIRAFKKAGWRRIGCSVELRFGGHWLALRGPLP